MIGKLTLPDGRSAEIKEEGWVSDDPAFQAYLRASFPIDESPARGQPGFTELQEAAEVLGGKAVFGKVDHDPSRVYSPKL